MFDESLLSERNLQEQLDLELLAGPIAQFGPTERERAIFGKIYVYQESEHATASQFGIAPRTMRNVARAMRNRLAQIEMEWDAQSLAELTAEWTRLDGLHRLAMQAFADTQEDERRFRHRRSPTDYLLIARRLGSMKLRLGVEIRRRRKLEALRPTPLAAEAVPTPAERAPAVRAPVATEPVVRRSRCGRRKILRGRRLRLPVADRRQPVRRSAACRRPKNDTSSGRWRSGIPPPGASRALNRLTRSHRRRTGCARWSAIGATPSPLAPG